MNSEMERLNRVAQADVSTAPLMHASPWIVTMSHWQRWFLQDAEARALQRIANSNMGWSVRAKREMDAAPPGTFNDVITGPLFSLVRLPPLPLWLGCLWSHFLPEQHLVFVLRRLPPHGPNYCVASCCPEVTGCVQWCVGVLVCCVCLACEDCVTVCFEVMFSQLCWMCCF